MSVNSWRFWQQLTPGSELIFLVLTRAAGRPWDRLRLPAVRDPTRRQRHDNQQRRCPRQRHRIPCFDGSFGSAHLLLSERLQRLDLRRSPRRNPARQHRQRCQQQWNAKQQPRIVGTHLEGLGEDVQHG